MTASAGVVVVGGGQGGFQIAASLRERGYPGPITIVSDESSAPYQRPPLSKAFLLGESDEERLLLRAPAFYQQQRLELLLNVRAIRIDRVARTVSLDSGTALAYDHLVLATGARNRKLTVPGADLEGVHYLRTLAEAQHVRARLPQSEKIVIVGAGFIGLELAAVASKLGKSVRVVDVMPRVMNRAVSHVMAEFFADTHRQWGVDLVLNAGVAEMRGDGGRVREVVTQDGRAWSADLVLVGIGVIANTELAAEAGLQISNGIVVDEMLRTSDPAISALGDCAFYPSRHCGPIRLESVQNAVDQGRCIAARIAGQEVAYDAVPWFWSDQRDIKLQMVGVTAGCDRTVLRGEPASRSFSVYCFRGEKLQGIESVNRPSDHMFGRKLLAAGGSIAPEQVSDPSFDPKALR